MNIAAVERETGISKDTLRVWERRYAFPTPQRADSGERLYSADEVHRLRLVKRLLDRGMRPGKLLRLDPLELARLADEGGETVRRSAVHDLALYLLKTHDTEGLRREFTQALMRDGVKHFVIEIASPLTRLVGAAWARGEIQVFEEHLFTEQLQGAMRQAIAQLAMPKGPPRILLATLPGELHSLGLLMTQAIGTLEGASCVSLGTQAPLGEIAAAAVAQKADVVALSISAAAQTGAAGRSVATLRAELGEAIELWCGGQGAERLRRLPEGVVVLEGLDGFAIAIERWHAARGQSPG